MKKSTAILLTASLALSAVQPALSAAEWVTYTDGDVELNYNTYNGSIEKLSKSSNTQDTAPIPNTKLETVTIPNSIDGTDIVSVADKGFFNYDALEYISLSKNLITIGAQAFAGCDNLKEISLPDSITTIQKASFNSCDNLTSVTIGKKLSTIDEQSFMNCKKLSSINIPSSVTSIGSMAFLGTNSLKTVILPNNLTTLGDSAFKDSGLIDITIPGKLVDLTSNTFTGCTSLKSVTISNGIKSIGKNAFAGCTDLEYVSIPGSCRNIADTAFDDCPKVVIYCKAGSFAEQFAKDRHISYTTGSTPIAEEDVPDTITVTLDGAPLDFGGVEPIIENGVTLVPMRVIFTALGITPSWDNETKTVNAKKGVTNISITVGKSKARVNGKEVRLDAPAKIVDGTTLVPVRFVSETLGVRVGWDANSRTVVLTTK